MNRPAAPSQVGLFTKPVRALMRQAPALTTSGTRLADAVAQMAQLGVSSLLVLDGGGRILGILTEQDVARRVVFRLAPDEPVDAAMTRSVHTVQLDDYLYRAVARMRRLGLRHMPVVDAQNRPVGMLDLHEAMAAASQRMMDLIDRLTQERSLEGLARTKRAQAELASELLADNLPAPEIQALISDINYDIHRRVLDGVLAEMEEEGWGTLPVPFTLLIMGSGGRGENFLYPDQDNGLILADYADAEHNRIDAFFIGLAERFTERLDKVGFPLCKGNVMATNPLWRKTATQWREQFRVWAERRSPVAVLFADIFLDFRPIAGPHEPATALRAFVTETLNAYPALLAMMCRDETSRTVALGAFGRLLRDRKGEHPGRIDLKMRGTMPLVASARLMALARGIPEVGTIARLSALAAGNFLTAGDAEELIAGFTHVTTLLLRQQLDDFHAGRRVGNFVDPDHLTRRERALLVDALRAIETYRKRVRADLTGDF